MSYASSYARNQVTNLSRCLFDNGMYGIGERSHAQPIGYNSWDALLLVSWRSPWSTQQHCGSANMCDPRLGESTIRSQPQAPIRGQACAHMCTAMPLNSHEGVEPMKKTIEEFLRDERNVRIHACRGGMNESGVDDCTTTF